MSTIALCIPAYNAEKVLTKLLDSASNQSNLFNEILIYNDASKDATKEIGEKYSAIVINGEINIGCAKGKNKLANIASSEWLHFHDADDILLPNFMQVAEKWITQKTSPDIILLHYHYVDYATGKFLGEPKYDKSLLKEDTIKFSIENKIVNFAIIRKDAFLKIGGFDTDKKVLFNEDRAFYTKAAISGLSFGYEPEVTCINYSYSSSMSSNNVSLCAQAQYNVWLKVLSKTNNTYNKEIAKQLLENATFAATANNWITVKSSVLKAKSIDKNCSPKGTKLFYFLFRLVSYYAYPIREFSIRYLTKKRSKN